MIIKAFGLASLLGCWGMASPTAGVDKALGLTEPVASYDAPAGSFEARQFVPIIQGIEGVLKYASDTLAAELEGSATSIMELQTIAARFTSRLDNVGLNTTSISIQLFDAFNKGTLATDAEIKRKITAASTRIWIVQALRACGGEFNKLCNIINVDAANAIGLDGKFVKQEICGVGG